MEESKKILTMSVGEMPGYGFDCECGRHHSVDINKILSGKGVLDQLPGALEEFRGRKILIVADDNTVLIGGNRVKEMMDGAGFIHLHLSDFVYGTTSYLPCFLTR